MKELLELQKEVEKLQESSYSEYEKLGSHPKGTYYLGLAKAYTDVLNSISEIKKKSNNQ